MELGQLDKLKKKEKQLFKYPSQSVMFSHDDIWIPYINIVKKTENKIYHTVWTIPQSNSKIPRNRVTISTPSKQIHDGSLS